MVNRESSDWRIVITGVGLTAPNGNNLPEFRQNLLNGISGIRKINIRYMDEVLAGVCDFDEFKYQKKKERRRGTRAGSIAVYCSQEAIQDSRIDWKGKDKSRVGIYLGTTEHGNVETENEVDWNPRGVHAQSEHARRCSVGHLVRQSPCKEHRPQGTLMPREAPHEPGREAPNSVVGLWNPIPCPRFA